MCCPSLPQPQPLLLLYSSNPRKLWEVTSPELTLLAVSWLAQFLHVDGLAETSEGFRFLPAGFPVAYKLPMSRAGFRVPVSSPRLLAVMLQCCSMLAGHHCSWEHVSVNCHAAGGSPEDALSQKAHSAPA